MDTSTKTWVTFFSIGICCWTFFTVSCKSRTTTLLHPLRDHLVAKRDSLQQQSTKKDTIYPFNPNRLSAWHAYRLDLPKFIVATIQSRVGQERYFQTAQEFKEFPGIPDQKWQEIEPLIRFTKWQTKHHVNKTKRRKKQLNAAAAQDLEAFYGIRPVLTARILSSSQELNGFWSEIRCKMFGGSIRQP